MGGHLAIIKGLGYKVKFGLDILWWLKLEFDWNDYRMHNITASPYM